MWMSLVLLLTSSVDVFLKYHFEEKKFLSRIEVKNLAGSVAFPTIAKNSWLELLV